MNQDQEKLTVRQAYQAMFAFLKQFNATYQSDDIAILLTGLSTDPNGLPLSQAYEEEWIEAVELAKSGKVSTASKAI